MVCEEVETDEKKNLRIWDRNGSKIGPAFLQVSGPKPDHIGGTDSESPDNFSGPESYFVCAMFALKTQILPLVLKADQ